VLNKGKAAPFGAAFFVYILIIYCNLYILYSLIQYRLFYRLRILKKYYSFHTLRKQTIMNFVAIDFETANFKRQSVCSIGLAIVENFKVVKTINKLIKPTPNYFERINISIHGIKPGMTENEKTFAELWPELKPYLENNHLIAHNASFDFSALRYVLDSYEIQYPTLNYYCSMQISKKLFNGLLNYQLPTVCKHLQIGNLNHHEATSDAIACANIMIKICEENGITSFSDLTKKLEISSGELFPNSYYPFSCNFNRSTTPKQLFEATPKKCEYDKEHPFFEKRVAFTGALSKLARHDAKKIVENIGGITTPDTLSTKTNYLVIGTYDFTQFGEGFKSSKLKKAEDLIAKGKELEIISEIDFFKMIHTESTTYEITISQIENDSEEFLKRNRYNDFYGKNIYFSSDFSINRLIAFQYVGNCGGFGHDYDTDEISNTDYFVIANKQIDDLKDGIKNQTIIVFEQIRNASQQNGNLKSVKLISETAFLDYIDRRNRFQKGEFKMNIYGCEVEK
jgi:DNA polymerase III subunit epsilon